MLKSSPLELNDIELAGLLQPNIKSHNFAGIALHTPLYIKQDNSDEILSTYTYQFRNCKVVWINPLILDKDKPEFSLARIFALGDKDPAELLIAARQFAGLVSFLSHFATVIEAKKTMGQAGQPFDLMTISQTIFLLGKYVRLSNGSAIGSILDVACDVHHPISDNAALSLSHLLEASSSFSPYWTYLCYWKILEVLYGRYQTNKSPLRAYIEGCKPLNHNQQGWIAEHKNAWTRLYGTRNRIGHWQDDKSPEIKDPADEKLRTRAEEDLPILQIFVRYALNPEFGLTAY